ncbi:Sec-independent protein translocase protein TatB [Aliamphritea spongicola]|uniref:Sec-independent protein translocase protein TatB n=1 Tax=Aliamphritea spongicola TaxID=707589 RepID=UPI00196B5801|nr:Sec-independent protein translocase protein TatB [Aliamphritea spongicola]MBN3561828.1 twin-arginine translocase subunit TatB [Aliamphritea spongicola]
MFDIGFAELLIIGVVGLIVLGPDKLPVAARTVGLWVGKARRTIGGIQSEINEELRLDEMRRQVAMQKDELDQELNEMRQPFDQANVDLQKEINAAHDELDKMPVSEPEKAETVNSEDKPVSNDRS